MFRRLSCAKDTVQSPPPISECLQPTRQVGVRSRGRVQVPKYIPYSQVFKGAVETDMGHGVMLWPYKDVDQKEFVLAPEADLQELVRMQWRKECRGLVVSAGGVVARPLHKFFSPNQPGGMKLAAVAGMIIQEATVKLDGIMLFGVVLDGAVELWTRGGRTAEAEKVTRWVYAQQDKMGTTGPVCEEVQKGVEKCVDWVGAVVGGSSAAGARVDNVGTTGPDYVGLVMAADALGHRVIFEWGGQAGAGQDGGGENTAGDAASPRQGDGEIHAVCGQGGSCNTVSGRVCGEGDGA